MKIHRLMQVMFVSGSVCAALPVLAAPLSSAAAPTPLCGEGEDKGEDEDDEKGETRLCGGDSDEDDGGEDEDDGETRQL